MVAFGRDICGNYEIASRKEWLITNGIGSYASGTVAGAHTRSYHGLLIAALEPPLGRTQLLSKLEETAVYDGMSFPLYCNHWVSGEIEPKGHRYIENFYLDGTTPVWHFALGDTLLEKRIWMKPKANRTYIRYKIIRPALISPGLAHRPVRLEIKAIVNFRDHHAVTIADRSVNFQISELARGLQIQPEGMDGGLYIFGDKESTEVHVQSTPRWISDYYLSMEAYRGLESVDDQLYAGCFTIELLPGEEFTLIATDEKGFLKDLQVDHQGITPIDLNVRSDLTDRRTHEQFLLDTAIRSMGLLDHGNMFQDELEDIRQIILAADQFIVDRASSTDPKGSTIIAGYHWFGDWGRDTMISLPGLTLVTGRPEVARRILRTFATFVDKGMLPNRFPDFGETPAYNTVDATLWYFQAVDEYFKATGDLALVKELAPVLKGIINWHQKGTGYGIHIDPEDGLLYAGEPGVQLTWMDAKVDDWVVTPRIGKPVEINALWYNALCIVGQLMQFIGEDNAEILSMAEKAKTNFTRFWIPEKSYCYDIIDGPEGRDESLRPNQIFAVSLPHSPLGPEQQQAVVDICAKRLLTSFGLRSLDAGDPNYISTYGGNRRLRDAAYHQGTVWGWLMGPFIVAHLRVYRDPETAYTYLKPLIRQINNHGIGSLSEIFDGEAPFHPRGCIAQAWTVAEVLRAVQKISKLKEDFTEQAIHQIIEETRSTE